MFQSTVVTLDGELSYWSGLNPLMQFDLQILHLCCTCSRSCDSRMWNQEATWLWDPFDLLWLWIAGIESKGSSRYWTKIRCGTDGYWDCPLCQVSTKGLLTLHSHHVHQIPKCSPLHHLRRRQTFFLLAIWIYFLRMAFILCVTAYSFGVSSRSYSRGSNLAHPRIYDPSLHYQITISSIQGLCSQNSLWTQFAFLTNLDSHEIIRWPEQICFSNSGAFYRWQLT